MNIGVIGCGSRIGYVVDWLISKYPQNKIVALYDVKKEATDNFLTRFNPEAKVYDSFEELSSDKNLDWVFIGSINKFHKEHILSALKNEKSVFTEKPLAISLADCLEIEKTFNQKTQKFFVSYPLRFSPHYKKIKEIIQAKQIGKIVSFEFNEILSIDHGGKIMTNWRSDKELSGGHILEKCCHDFDIANWLLEDVPKKIASFGGLNFFTPENTEVLYQFNSEEKNFLGKKWNNKNPFIEQKAIVDNQVAILEYSKGARATFHTNSASSLPERKLYICGTKGTIKADVLTGEIELKIFGKETVKITDKFSSGGHGGGDEHLINELNDVINGKDIGKNHLNSALKSSITALAADSSRLNNEIVNLENLWEKLGINS